MTFPNFLIIGAAKSGTTSLYKYLKQHPEIYLSPKKEPGFFAFENQDAKFTGPGDQAVLDRILVTDLSAYQGLFDAVTEEKAIGEASAFYLYIATTPGRIKHYIPNVKLIALLRNPIERALSSFTHLRRDGREPLDNFAEAIRAEKARVRAGWEYQWHYTRVGFYYTQLKRYYNLFSPEQIAVYTYDEFVNDPIKMLQDIFSFLEVDPSFRPNMSVKYNVSGQPKLRFLHHFLIRPSIVKSLLKMLIPACVRLQTRRAIMKLNIDPIKPKISEETREYLNELFQNEILNLEVLINRDLSNWL
jgi:hypothetical protein